MRLTADNKPQWGKMNAGQVLAHCSAGLEMGTGELRPPRSLIGRIIGGMVKSKVLANEEPLRKNTPTAKELIVRDNRDFSKEQARLSELIDRFASGGKAGCTTHPHTFFGALTPDEWSLLMYKHLDHHMRQLGV